MWNSHYRGNDSISIFIGDEFSPCHFHNQIINYKLCKSGIIQNDDKIEIQCNGKATIGQYIAVVKGNFLSDESNELLYICELEAFGRMVFPTNRKKRPEISSESLLSITKHFDISRLILKDVTSITLPDWSGHIKYSNKNCNPIIYDKSSKAIFSVACQTMNEKGRFAIFGRKNFFSNILKDSKMITFKNNLLLWLSPNSLNSSIIDSKEIKKLEDLKNLIKKGDIIYYYELDSYPNDVMEEMISMLKKGIISIVFDHDYWISASVEARNSYEKILNLFNVMHIYKYINQDKPMELKFSSEDLNRDFLDIEIKLENIAKNHEEFLLYGESVIDELNEFNTILKRNIIVRPYLEAIIMKYNELIKRICPCKINPTTNIVDKEIIRIFNTIIKSNFLADSNYKAPCVDLFPGDYSTDIERNIVTLTVNSPFSGILNPIGYYLEPGKTLNYKVHRKNGEWTINIGCHQDNIARKSSWFRYPSIHSKENLENEGKIYSPFGGSIWLLNENKNQTITLTITNVVATPFLNVRDKFTIEKWNVQRKNIGLWSIIAGDNIMFCEESKKIRNYDGQYLSSLMTDNWDMIVRMDFELKSLNWQDRYQEIVVSDILPAYGNGHSGYPIVVQDYWHNSIFNKSSISQIGSWGMCHEIGHNMVNREWAYPGTIEVINNVFCLFNFDKLWNLSYYGSRIDRLNNDNDEYSNIKLYLDAGANFNNWVTSPYIALSIYSQMANNFGFGFYKKVFSYYQVNKILPEKENLMFTWINITSIIVGQNLLPIYDFWGFPIDSKIANILSVLPCLYPDDFFRNISESRTKYIESKYKNCHTKSTFYEDFKPTNFYGQMRSNFVNELKMETLPRSMGSFDHMNYINKFSKDILF